MSKRKELKKLEKEFKELFIKSQQSQQPDNDAALEKVVRDMTDALCNLKDSIRIIKNPKTTSHDNIENELEWILKRQKVVINEHKANEQEKKKAVANKKNTNRKKKAEKRNSVTRNSQIIVTNLTCNVRNIQEKNTGTAAKKTMSNNSNRLNSPQIKSNNKTSSKTINKSMVINKPMSNNRALKIKNKSINDTTLLAKSTATMNQSNSKLSNGPPKIINKPVIRIPVNKANNNEVSKSVSITNQSVITNASAKLADRPRSLNVDSTLKKNSTPPRKNRSYSLPPPREIYNPLGIIKDEVDKAIREHKTFTIKGQFGAVRKALLSRGWIEKYHTNYSHLLNQELKKYQQYSVPELLDMLRNKDLTNLIKKMIKSKLLKDHQVDLYWDSRFDAFKECPDTNKLTLISKFRRDSLSYTSKQGLCQASREAHWLHIPGVSQINHPRCYTLIKGGDTQYFLKDFGLTAAVSFLKWIIKNNITGESKIVSATGKIPMKTFDFAIAECYKFIKKHKHQDIDEEIGDALEVDWKEFLDQFYKAVHVGHHFKLPDNKVEIETAKNMIRKSTYLLNQIKEYMPCFDMDGYMNIWILKPTNSSRGEGIHICRTLQFILDILKKNPTRRYVVQKYIERPMLIHDTKFDIRQWFLVTSSYPLIIWMYKTCYLRFSSQTYNLRKLHESIHLTNNSVQAKYMNRRTSRDPLLPSYGMWDSMHFKNYLSDIGYPRIFETVIYPGMKQCITGAMIAHREKIDKRKNCFELYGADFMLSETFEPWLLEINSSPALHGSTPITAKLCPEVLEDVIKVVVDNARNPNAGTGNFELIYKENNDVPNNKPKLRLNGKPLPEDYFYDVNNNEISVNTGTKSIPKTFEIPDPGKILLETGETMKEALKNLLDIVKREKLKRRLRKEKSVEAKPELPDNPTQNQSELLSLFERTKMFEANSEISLQNIKSQEEMTDDETREVSEVLGELKLVTNKKKVLSNLVKVVDTLRHLNNNKK